MCLPSSRSSIRSFGDEQFAKTTKGPLGLQAGAVDVLPQVIHVGLHVAELQRLDAGYADAGSHIAHQVKNTGGVAHALSWNRIVRNRGQWDKNQAETCTLQHERPPEIPEAYVQAEE